MHNEEILASLSENLAYSIPELLAINIMERGGNLVYSYKFQDREKIMLKNYESVFTLDLSFTEIMQIIESLHHEGSSDALKIKEKLYNFRTLEFLSKDNQAWEKMEAKTNA